MRKQWVLPAGGLLLALWIGLFGVWTATPSEERSLVTEADRGGASGSAAGVPVAALELRVVEDGLLLSGEMPSEAAAAELLRRAQVVYAPLIVRADLRIRAEAAESAWLGAALAVMPLPMPGIESPEWLVSAEGLRVGGVAADAEFRNAVRATIAQGFGGVALQDNLRLATGASAPAAPRDRAGGATATPTAAEPARSGPAADPTVSPVSPAPVRRHPRQAELDAMLAVRPPVFASGSARLQRDRGPDWQAIASWLKQAEVTVTVRGHTDDRGGADANRRLSARRAEAVRQALIRAGVTARRIRTEGVGEAEPLGSNASAEGRRQNRRIELRLEVES